MFSVASRRPHLAPHFVGMVHLLPLPGGPQSSQGLAFVRERALKDAAHLVQGGVDAILIENLGDAPFKSDNVDPWTISAMTHIIDAIKRACPTTPLGVNVLRNDARSAMAIAATTGASFIRVNIWVGTMVTDQGIITGKAREVLMDRQRLNANVEVLADVHVKHAVPLGPSKLADAARDVFLRGGADGLILTGTGTGAPTDLSDLAQLRERLPQAPLWIGSGVTPDTLPMDVEGVIVGTWLHEEADLSRPIDPHRVSRLRTAIQQGTHQAANNRS